MATYSSKREKRQDLTDFVVVLLGIALVTMLVGSAGYISNNPFALQTSLAQSNVIAVSNSGNVSFAMDEQYWDANCSHGWNSDSQCENIMLRAQACSVANTSTYCSDYKKYMQQFQHRAKNVQS